MNNDKRPIWINIINFIKLLNCKQTQEEIAKKFSDRFVTKEYGVQTNSHEEDAKKFFPLFLRDLRIFDITDSKYWGASFMGVILFLLIESIIFLLNDFAFARLIAGISLGLVILVVLYFAVFFFFLRDMIIRNYFYSIPVIVTSLGLIVLNSILIIKTGWTNSPFLPAFIFTNFTIITAPRENSKTILFLTFVAVVIILIPYFYNSDILLIKVEQNYQGLSKTINILTLIFTVIIVIVSRSFSSKKIIENISKNEK